MRIHLNGVTSIIMCKTKIPTRYNASQKLHLIDRNTNLDVIFLGENDFDMTGRGHVGVDSAVSAVRSAPHQRCAVDLDVVDDEVIDVEAFVVGVRLGVLQQRQEELRRFLGPTSLTAGSVPSFGLSVTTGAADVTPGGGKVRVSLKR